MSGVSRSISRFAAIFAGGTLFSRVLGLVRDLIISAVVTPFIRDVFIFGFRLPNMLRDLIGEGAMNAAFVPVLSERLERDGREGFRELTAALLSAMLLLLGALTLAGVLAMPYLSQLFLWIAAAAGEPAPAESGIALYIQSARWMFPYLLFIGLAVFTMGPLFTMGRYGTPAWSPALLNVALIAAVLLQDRFPTQVHALIFGVWLGGAAQLVVLFHAMRKHCGVWLPNFRLGHPGLRQAFLLMIPVIFGQAAGEINKLVDSLFAASLDTGTIWQLYCANRLIQLPLSVFGIAVAVSVLPGASRAAAAGQPAEIRAGVLHGLRQTFFLVFPAMMGLMVLAEPLVRLLFERGAFSALDSARTANALMAYGLGLLGFAGVKVAVSGFYAQQDTKTPVLISSGSMLLNIALNFALVRPLDYIGLAMATSIAFTVNFALLWTFLSRRLGVLWDRDAGACVAKTLAAGVIMAAGARLLYVGLARWFVPGTFWNDLILAGMPVLTGIAIYAGCAWLFRMSEFHDFWGIVRNSRQNR